MYKCSYQIFKTAFQYFLSFSFVRLFVRRLLLDIRCEMFGATIEYLYKKNKKKKKQMEVHYICAQENFHVG